LKGYSDRLLKYHTGWNRLQYSALYHCSDSCSGDNRMVANKSQTV